MTVGTDGGVRRGFRLNSYGALDTIDFDGINISRVWLAEFSVGAPIGRLLFGAPSQYQDTTILTVQYGDQNPIPHLWSGSDYDAVSSADTIAAYDFLNSNVGNDISMTIAVGA